MPFLKSPTHPGRLGSHAKVNSYVREDRLTLVLDLVVWGLQ